ncbi:MAG: hypothetical protein IT359_16040 [Gemmatimonadaceae bacterium]|nr:hypothetical protein [Gemmatimonadaceae bacterium]
MINAARLRRFAPIAILLTVTSLVTACSTEMTGPSAKSRSGYITTSASVAPVRSTSDTVSTGTAGSDSTDTPPVRTPAPSRPGKGNKTLSSGYNVPAL